MACQIPYDSIKELFVRALAYNKPTYNSYRNMAMSITQMSIPDESKVQALWFTGILYNQAQKFDSEIVTEDLPFAVSELVVDKLNDPTVDFTDLLEQVKSLFKPAAPVTDEKADIEGGVPTQPPITPKPLTLKQQLKKLLSKANSGKSADIRNAINEFNAIVKSNPEADNPTLKNTFIADLKKIINEKTSPSTKMQMMDYLEQVFKINQPPSTDKSAFIDIASDPTLGLNFYVIRQEDGTLVHAVLDETDSTYYVYDSIFNGLNFEDLDTYNVNPTDSIVPVYYQTTTVIDKSYDKTGGRTRINDQFTKNGITLDASRLVESEILKREEGGVVDTRKNREVIGDSVGSNPSLLNRKLRIVADRRRINLNNQRIAMIKQQYPNIEYEVDLKRVQIDYIKKTKNPVVGFIRQRKGIQLTLELADSPYFSYINSLDNLGLVYPNNVVRPINWNDANDVAAVQSRLQVYKNGSYVTPSQEDMLRLRDAVFQIRDLKNEIMDMMGDDVDTFVIPSDLVNKYLNINNVIQEWGFALDEETGRMKPSGKLSSLYETLVNSGSTFKATIADFNLGEISNPEETDIIGVIRKDKNNPNGFSFVSTIESNKQLVDADNNVIPIDEFFKNQGIDFARINEVIGATSFKTFYLYNTPRGWSARPIQAPPRASAPEEKINFLSSLMALKGVRPEYSPDNKTAVTEFIQKFNNKGWGFNTRGGYAANIDYIKQKKNKDGSANYIFGIRFRAWHKGIANMEAFNDANLVIEFNLDAVEINKNLNELYKAAGKDITKFQTLDKRLELAQSLSEGLRKNADTLSDNIKEVMSNLEESYDAMVTSLGSQLNKLIADNPSVITEPHYLRTMLFENTASMSPSSFKLRNPYPNKNPLDNFMIFEKGSELRRYEMVVSLKRRGILPQSASANTIAPNPPSPKKVETVSSKPKINRPGGNTRVKSVVDSLDSVKIVGDEVWNKQVSEIQRLLGKLVTTEERDITDEQLNAVVLGYFEKNVITLNNKIKAGGVAYHEAFHAVFRLAFKDKQRSEYLNAVKTISGGIQSDAQGKFISYKGNKEYLNQFRDKRRFEGVPDEVVEALIYEEFLAEDFKAYKESGVTPTNALIARLLNILDKILEFFTFNKKVAANRKIRAAFRSINAGLYADRQGDPYEAPRAYELSRIPDYIDSSSAPQTKTVSNLVNDELRDRIVSELLQLPFGEINTKSAESFNAAYNKVTAELIAYYKIPDNIPNAEKVKMRYGPMFRDMRYMMGAAHRSDISEVFVYENKSGNPELDNYPYYVNESGVEESEDNLSDSIQTFEEFRKQVKEEYMSIGLIGDKTPSTTTEQVSELEDEAQIEDTNEEVEDPEEEINQEEVVGERFDDNPYYKPFDGNANFKKLLRYIKYEYQDPELGYKFDRMVNSKTIMDRLSVILANVPLEEMIPTLNRTIENLKDTIDSFYNSRVLSKNLNGVLPKDMVDTKDLYNMLSATMDLIKRQTDMNTDGVPVNRNGIPFYNMFHKVFDNAIIPVISVGYATALDQRDDATDEDSSLSYFNTASTVDLVETNNVRRITNALRNDIVVSLNNITSDQRAQVNNFLALLPANRESYKSPQNKKELEFLVNTMHSITSILRFNIPRTVIEFSIISDAFQRNVEEGKSTRSSYFKNMIDDNYDYWENRSYFDPSLFRYKITELLDGYAFTGTVNKNPVLNKFIAYYSRAARFQNKFNPGFATTRLKNLDKKAINQLSPYSPDVRLVHMFKKIVLKQNRPFEDFVSEVYNDPGLMEWFADNPMFDSLTLNYRFDSKDKSAEAKRLSLLDSFMQKFAISQSGGFFQNMSGINRQKATTQKTIGDKSFMLMTIGLFANRIRYIDNYGQEFFVFNKPITTYEATSTMYMSSALYTDYASQGKEDLIIENYKRVIKQEYNRIKREYANRYNIPVNKRWEGYNVITNDDSTLDVDNPRLRAYNFNRIKPFYQQNEVSIQIKNLLINAAKNGKEFDQALEEALADGNTINSVINDQIQSYVEYEYKDFKQYLNSLDINMENDIPSIIRIDDVDIVSVPLIERQATKKLNELGIRVTDKSAKNQETFLRDFFYNFHFNSLFLNQFFDGDHSIGIDNFAQYFKRKKSGVASGLTYRNTLKSEQEDTTRISTIQSVKAYFDKDDPYKAVSTNADNGPTVMEMADGQTYTSIERRIQKSVASGLATDDVVKILRKARFTKLSFAEITILADNDIYLNSDKPVVAHPLHYLKDSEHVILRTDVSYIPDPELQEVVELLYDELDSIDYNDPDVNGLEKYQEIIAEIHSYFLPKNGRQLLHHYLNAVEYFRVDKLFDTSVSKRATRSPLVLNTNSIEDGYLDDTVPMQVPTATGVNPVPAIITVGDVQYINLGYNLDEVGNNFVYEQVKVSESDDVITDPIQENLHIPSQLTKEDYPHLKSDIEKVAKLQEDLAKSRKATLEALFKTSDPRTLITKMIQSGLIDQGVGGNILKYYSINSETNTAEFNLNLPIMGKTPMYYFFSLYNKTVFAPKVAGKKYIHASPAGYKLVIDKNGKVVPRELIDRNPAKYATYETRYPKVEYIDGKIYVEAIIPRQLAGTAKERRFFEKLYADFLGSRIPIEGKRSSVVIKVVDYIDEAYGNTIILPTQVHYWAGSDMDVDAVYSKRYDYYEIYKGKKTDYVKYGDYEYLQKEYGVNEDEAKFIEYLYFTASDPAFKELISAEKRRLKEDVNLKSLSMKVIGESFGGKLKEFFGDVSVEQFGQIIERDLFKELREGIVLETGMTEATGVKPKKGVGLESLSTLMNVHQIIADKEVTKSINMLRNMVAVVNVLKEYNLPSKPAELKSFTKKNGNPVSSAIFNELLTAKMNLLRDSKVQEDFVFNQSGDDTINKFKATKDLLSNITTAGSMESSDLFSPQSVGRVRQTNSGSKRMVGYNANLTKGAIVISTAKVKLSPEYSFNVTVNGTKIIVNQPNKDSVKRVGNTVGVSTDDGKHQVLGVHTVNGSNTSAMGAMDLYGYPEQFTKIIHSVGLINKIIRQYLLNVDPGYAKPKQLNLSLQTHLNNEFNQAIIDIPSLVKYTKSEDGVYKINPSTFTIDIKEITQKLNPGENTPSALGITLTDKDGKVLPDSTAQILMLGFYAKMLEVGNGISFNFSTVTNVLKAIQPSMRYLNRIRNAAKFIKENTIFQNSEDIYKSYPIIEYLLQNGIRDMEQNSQKILLDQTNIFKGIISTLDKSWTTDTDKLTQDLKSVMGWSVFRTYIDEKLKSIDPETSNPLDRFIVEINKALDPNYWFDNSVKNDLDILKDQFKNEDNEFLRILSSRPVFISSNKVNADVEVIASNAGSRLLPESQNRLINDFYYLVNHSDESVRDRALRIAAHGMVKDGAIPSENSFLKLIAPGLFQEFSMQLDKIQEELYKIDTSDKIKTSTQYIEKLDAVFNKLYNVPKDKPVTSDLILKALLYKMIGVVSLNEEMNKALSMSFSKASINEKTGKRYSAGKFSDIELLDFAEIVKNILPQNADKIFFIQTTKTGTKRVMPVKTGVTSTVTVGSRFELWKADDNGMLSFDLTKIPDKYKKSTDRILKQQGIFFNSKTGEYGFPLYQINTFDNGQLFVLDTIDGKPFNQNFFKNLFEGNLNNEPFEFLLRGKKATYKIIDRQGIDMIKPHAFTNANAITLRNRIVGEVSKTSSQLKKVKELPEDVMVYDSSFSVGLSGTSSVDAKSSEKAQAELVESFQRISKKSFSLDQDTINIGGTYTIYTTSSTKRGVLYINKNEATADQIGVFANKLGYASREEFISENEDWFFPKKGQNHILLSSFTLTKPVATTVTEVTGLVELQKTEPVRPTAPVTSVSATPEFDKLPAKSATPTMTYAGIGSRKTPSDVLETMTKIAKRLENLGYTLRSGGAVGADTAFEKGATKKQIFYSKGSTERTRTIAKEIHPAPTKISGIALDLMARNTNQIFGENLDTPVDFVIAWTPDGAETSQDRTIQTGGTGQAIDMASRKGIPVINLANPGWENRIKELITPAAPAQMTSVADIPQNKVSGVESYGSLVTANAAAIKALGPKPHSIDMIEAGFRTRTTRSDSEMKKYAIKVGDVVKHFGKSADGTTKTIYAKVTAIHPKGSPGWKGTWAKEGWRAEDVNVIDRFKDGAAAIEFELITPKAPTQPTTSTTAVKPGVEELFESNPELASIGTPEQYSAYLDTVFPDSKVKDIVYHGADIKIEKFTNEFFGTRLGTLNKAREKTRTAIWFSNFRGAKTYGDTQIPVLLNIKNPGNGIQLLSDKYEEFTETDFLEQDDIEEFKEMGYDGLTGADFLEYNPEFIVFDANQVYVLGSEQDIQGFNKFVATPAAPAVQEKTITYTPVGKERQTYTIRGNKIFNKAGREVFKEDSVDRNKIFANLAVQEGRAVIVEHKGAKYIVNNRQQIISGTTGKIMQWGEENGDRRAILAKANETRVTPTQAPRGVQVKEGIYVNQGALTREEQLALFNYLKPYLEKQAAKTNKAAAASKMIGLGLRWDYKSNNPGRSAMDIPDIIDPKSKAKYGYYTMSINGQRLGKITPEFRQLIEKASGVDMSKYDGAIINLYEANSFISSHNDVDESSTAINYPVVGINLGGSGNFSIESRDGNPMQLDLQSGTAYVFGVGGVNREVYHRTFPSPQDSFLPELTTEIDGKTYPAGSYRVTITMRRVMPLEPGMPTSPKMSSSQPTAPKPTFDDSADPFSC